MPKHAKFVKVSTVAYFGVRLDGPPPYWEEPRRCDWALGFLKFTDLQDAGVDVQVTYPKAGHGPMHVSAYQTAGRDGDEDAGVKCDLLLFPDKSLRMSPVSQGVLQDALVKWGCGKCDGGGGMADQGAQSGVLWSWSNFWAKVERCAREQLDELERQ